MDARERQFRYGWIPDWFKDYVPSDCPSQIAVNPHVATQKPDYDFLKLETRTTCIHCGQLKKVEN